VLVVLVIRGAHRMFMVQRVLVGRTNVVLLRCRWDDPASETQHSEDEETDPVWGSARLRPLCFSLMTVSHANPVGLIRIPHAYAHVPNPNETRSNP
jgi:hypothetical protein